MSSVWSPNFTLLKPPVGEQMKLLPTIVLILSVMLTSEMLLVSGQSAKDTTNVQGEEDITFSYENVQAPIPLPTETPYPKPNYNYVPILKPYVINKDHDIWHPQDAQAYITPDNEWVKYYASLLYIDYDGRIRYKNRTTPLVVDAKGNVLSWTDEPFVNNYVSDNEQFNYPPDADMWVLPEYYLTNGMRDDCDGWMVTVTSLMLSGEMSVRNNETFVKKFIPAKAVLGYMGGYRDGWTEYQVYGKTFLTTTAMVNSGISGIEKKSSTEFVEKKNKTTAVPIFEFTNNYFGKYKTS